MKGRARRFRLDRSRRAAARGTAQRASPWVAAPRRALSW